jgi:hypothetical protein
MSNKIKAKVGDRFAPNKYFNKNKGIFIPDEILKSDLSPEAKLLYGFLMKHAGDGVSCTKTYEEMEEGLNLSSKVIIETEIELEERHFLQINRPPIQLTEEQYNSLTGK